MPDRSGNRVELWVKVQKDDEEYPKTQDWEDLWAWLLPNGKLQIDNVPFFAKDLAFGDIVAVTPTEEGVLVFDRVVERSGHSTFRIWLHEHVASRREQIIADLELLAAKVEITLNNLLGIDVTDEHEAVVWEYVEAGRERDDWGLQVGYSPD